MTLDQLHARFAQLAALSSRALDQVLEANAVYDEAVARYAEISQEFDNVRKVLAVADAEFAAKLAAAPNN